ncbi:MAG: hypothetical protein MUQ00_15410 [Candidatus Aminicenantes bacterium]|nr:hypothetical protein [Candidatus Aminicenantes bacterium]
MTYRRRRSLYLVAAALSLSLIPAGARSQTEETDLASILDKVAEKTASYLPLESWKATVRSVQTKVDKNWKPEKVTNVQRIMTVRKEDYDEQILKADEVEKGRTKDITEKYAKDSRERLDKRRRKEAERKTKGKAADEGDRREMSLKEFFPFEQSRRADFTFSRLADATLDGRAALAIEVKARLKDEKNWEGTYLIAADSFDVLKVVLRPSKNPKFVKELEMEMTLMILPGNHLVLRSSRARINGGIFIKHVRMISEDEYSDYEIL